MDDAHPGQELATTLRELTRTTQAWALEQRVDAGRLRELRRKAILANHAYYLEHIPIYGRFAQEEGIGALDDVEPIKRHLMFADDLFKSYDQSWLDERDFGRMNLWLSEIYHRRVDVDVGDVTSIDGWIDRLAQHGVRLVYSSGTSGTFSFVPRSAANLALLRTVSTFYLTPYLLSTKLGNPLQQLLVRLACRLVSPEAFVRASQRAGLSGFDAVFLDFRQGRTGNQSLEQELAPLFRKHYFLYDTDLSPSVLRLATRGPRTEEDREQLLALQEVVVGQKAQNYRRVMGYLRSSTAEGQRVFMFGTPVQFKELCETIAAEGEGLQLNEGSLILFGGGWKSFTGERIPRDVLLALMSENLGLPAQRIMEGYSMTEISAFTLRCDHGRFHIPPFIEPVLFDEELEIVEGSDVRGTLGFLDPLAISYPGFIISGDEVHFVDGPCPCGLGGPAVTEIGRARHREVKGCGGIMASLAA